MDRERARSIIRWCGGVALLCALVLFVTLSAAPVRAATDTVSVCTNGVAGQSLDYWVANAAAGDTITFSPGLDCTGANAIATVATLTINVDLTIDGTGASIVIDGGNQGGTVQSHGIFQVGAVTAALSNLTIQNGYYDDLHKSGGIDNSGTLTVAHCTLSGNYSATGGGINNSGALTVTDSVFTANVAVSTAHGGGLYNASGHSATVTHSTFSTNSAIHGGGIYNDTNGTLTVTDSTVSTNSAETLGGGLYNSGNGTLTGSTVSNNTGGFEAPNLIAIGGGGIYTGGTLTLTNSSLTGNHAGEGGGITSVGTLTISGSTISANLAGTSGTGGGIQCFCNATVSDSTFSNNSAGGGGAIEDEGSVTVTHTTFTGNTAGEGGGIQNELAHLTVMSSIFSGNSATSGRGGGIYAYGDTTISDSTFSGNTIHGYAAGAGGGGVFHFGGTLTVTDSSFADNTAPGYDGGGILEGGTLTVANSTFSHNAANLGGGIFSQTNNPSTLTVTGSTFAGNTATSSTGGGIYVDMGTAHVANSTFSGNSAAGGGGGGGAFNHQGTLSLTNSTVAGNAGGGIGNITGSLTVTNTILTANTGPGNCSGTITDGGHNLEWSPTTCGFATGSPKFDVKADPMLLPLANNGGPTQTMELGSGSAAIGAGDPAVCAAAQPTGAGGVDQRGAPRGGGVCSIGAVEPLSGTLPVPKPTGPPAGSPPPVPQPRPTGPDAGSLPAPLPLPRP